MIFALRRSIRLVVHAAHEHRRQLQRPYLCRSPGPHADCDPRLVREWVRQNLELFSINSNYLGLGVAALFDLRTDIGYGNDLGAGTHTSSLSLRDQIGKQKGHSSLDFTHFVEVAQ